MIGNLKTLGVVMLVLGALGATAAASASAQTSGKFTSDGPFTLVGTQTSVAGNPWTMFGESIECSGSAFTGHKVNTTLPHKFIEPGEIAATITWHPAGCVSSGGLPVTVDTNGCDFELVLGETAPGEDTYVVRTYFKCPVGQHVQMTVFSSSSHAFRVCTMTVKQNAGGYTGPHIRSTTGPHDLDLEGSFGGLQVDKSDRKSVV